MLKFSRKIQIRFHMCFGLIVLNTCQMILPRQHICFDGVLGSCVLYHSVIESDLNIKKTPY